MYKCVSPVCPTVEMLKGIPFARTPDHQRYVKALSDTVFVSSHTRTGYRRRNMQLIGKDFDAGDLVVILLLLLMAGDCEEDRNNAVLTIALYFMM